MKSARAIVFLILVAAASVSAEPQDFDASPWLKPRSLEDFKSLLDRSPFSLPTAEETIAAEERFFLTGAATINGKPVVFIFDKNTQDRRMLEKFEGPEAQGRDRLIELSESSDPKNLTAKINIEGKVTEIRFSESSFASAPGQPPQGFAGPNQPMPPGQQPGQPGQPGPQIPAFAPNPAAVPPSPVPQQPNQNNAAIQPGSQDNSQPPRRVIRRRVISNQPPAAQPIPGQ
jgi:hypothetical protein